MSETVRQSNWRHLLPWAGRWLFLAGAVALAWPWGRESPTSVVLPALSPFIAVASLICLRTASLLTLLAVPVLMLAVIYPRWFCRHGCPVGLLQEFIERFRPKVRTPWRRLPSIGKWLVLLTLGGAMVGYPLFAWLDPLAIFNGFLNAWRHPLAIASLLAGLGLPMLLLIDFVLPRLWCQRICPLGATQDLLAMPRRRIRLQARCNERDRVGGASDGKPSRRWFLAVCAGSASAFIVKPKLGPAPGVLRPPGSLDDSSFTGVCVRCGNCAQVCPSRIIQSDFGDSGLAGFLTPRLRFDQDYCREDCRQCGQVCPSGAIRRLSLAEKRQRVIGPAVVDLDTCLLSNGRECTACIKRCPHEAIAMHSSDGGFSSQPGVDLAKCTGCGACEAVCPVRPQRAICVLAQPGRLARISTSSPI